MAVVGFYLSDEEKKMLYKVVDVMGIKVKLKMVEELREVQRETNGRDGEESDWCESYKEDTCDGYYERKTSR